MKKTKTDDLPLTMSIPEGGEFFLGHKSRSQSYRAAASGALITIESGPNRWRVPTPAMLKKLEEAGEK